jgi:hypothetical protein
MDALCCRYFNLVYVTIALGMASLAILDAWALDYSISKAILPSAPAYSGSWTEGLTRATKALLEGSVGKSIEYHPLALATIVFFTVQLGLRPWFLKRPTMVYGDLAQQSVGFITMVLLLAS